MLLYLDFKKKIDIIGEIYNSVMILDSFPTKFLIFRKLNSSMAKENFVFSTHKHKTSNAISQQ